jgi:hypothetical protein
VIFRVLLYLLLMLGLAVRERVVRARKEAMTSFDISGSVS